MKIINDLEWRYACKKFDKERKLTQTQIELLKNAFNLTPTSFGLQPIKLFVVKEDKTKEALFPHTYYQQQTTTCSHLLGICIDTSFNQDSIDAYFDLEKRTRGTSEEVIGKFRKELKDLYSKWDPSKIEASSIFQAYIALGNLMTVCAHEKIDCCPMEGFIPAKVDEVLGLKNHNLRSVLLLPVGYRAKDDIMNNMKKVRKQLSEVIIEID